LLFAGGFLGQVGSLDRLGVSCGSGPVHEQEHSGMWEFANNVPIGLQGVTGGGGLAETKVVGTPSDVVRQRVACGGGSGDRRLEVMVSEGECEGGFPSVGATRVEPEEVRVLEVNEVNRSLALTSGKEMGIEEVKSDVAVLQFDDPNLVDVRVDQTVFLVQQTNVSKDAFCTTDSAIENCNRIYWEKNDKKVASNVWSVGKEAGFSHSGQEDAVINSLHALTVRKVSKGRKPRKKSSKFCQ